MKVVWFKRDLRLHDHEALHEALSTSGKTLLLYIFEPSLIKDYHYSQRHFDFIKQSLEALQKELQKYHTQILIVQGEATTIFKKLSEQIEISTVYSHQETGIKLTYERDLAVAELLKEKESSGKNTSLMELFVASKTEKLGKKIGMITWIKIVCLSIQRQEVL